MTQERKAEAQEDASVSAMTPGSTHPKKPRGRQSRGTTREHELLVHVPAALWECWDPCYWWTHQRHCGMLGPEILVDVPAASCERWAQRVRHKSGHPPLGNQPENWWAERRSVCQVTPWYFLTRLVPPSRSQRSSTWCRRGWDFDHRGLALASSYFLLLPLLFFSRRFSFLCLLSAAARFRRFLSLRHIWPDFCCRQGVLLLHFDLDYLGHGPHGGRTAALR